MADFRVNVTADTQDAERKLRSVDKNANEATKARSLKIGVSGLEDINKRFKNINADIKAAGNNIQTFYRISKNIPGIGERVREFEGLAKGAANLARTAPESAAALRENAKAGSILSNSFETAGGAAGRLINSLAKAGFALFAVKEAVGLLRGAFNGFFNETIGREVKLRETILKTQTTLASTNRVFKNNTEITDPYQKIVNLTGAVRSNIDSIRERSIALAGVTSNEVIEVFGIVATQIGQIGGGLKEAEDLAINFAAALGTFGIPLYQARQEVGSILRGDITMDSYLAKALGITNEDVARAKTQAGGVIKFLEERLAASVAGQRIAAEGFSGVVSNIRDLSELFNQRLGAGLLDPLLGGLSSTFELLFKIREQLFAIADAAGGGIGSILGTNLTIIGGSSDLFQNAGAAAGPFATQLAEGVKKAFASLQSDANAVIAPVRNLLEELSKSIAALTAGLARLAEGFVSIQIENFKALVQVFSNLSEVATIFSGALGQILRAYGQLLQVPFVQYLSQLSTQFQLLEKLGVMSAVKLGIAAVGLITAWTPIVTFFQGLVARIAAILGGLVIAVGAAFTKIGAVVAAFAGTLASTYPAVEALKQQLLGLSTSLTATGVAADKAGVSVTKLGGATAAAARTASGAIMGFVKLNLILFGVQLAVTLLIDVFGRFQRAQAETSRSNRAAEALRRLQTTYKDVGESASSATKAARDFEQALVDAQYNKNIDALEEVREKINQIRYELKPGIQSWGEFWAAASGEEMGRFEERAQSALADLREQEKRIKAGLGAVDKERDKKALQDNIRLESQNRTNLEKEIGELRKQQEDQLFQLRQSLAQKEVDIFRAAGELRIFQMEQANAKLIEGEEGASRTALEALNTYLAVRERGELDIESAKKQLVIEATNLEKQIADYRLENEKKIADIRKKAGQYEQRTAEYQRQLAATPIQGPPTPGNYAGRTGGDQADASRGRSTGAHLHAQGRGMSEAALRAFIDQALVFPDGAKASQYGTSRGYTNSHGGIDYLTPQNTPFTLAPGFSSRNMGIQGNLGLGMEITGPDGRKAQLGHLMAASNQAGRAGAVPPPPTAPDFSTVAAPATEKYAEAVRNLASAMERVRALQAALTEARTAAAFDEIAKAAFPQVQLEQYRDQLVTAQTSLKALAETANQAYDPERLGIQIDLQSKVAIQEEEIKQIYAKAVELRNKGNLSEAELQKLKEDLLRRQDKYLEQLKQEAKLRDEILGSSRQQAAIESLRTDTRAIGFEVRRAGFDATSQMVDTFAGDDPMQRRRADAELRIAERRLQLEEQYTEITPEVQAELRAFAAATRASATTLGELDQSVLNFQRAMGLIRESASTITDSYKGFASAILTGGDFEDALVNALESMTGSFLDMFLEAAFKPIEDYLVQQFKDLFKVEDPTQQLEAENTAAVTSNTAAIQALTAALTPGAAATSASPQALPVEAFNAGSGAEDLSAQFKQTSSGLSTFNQQLPQLSEVTAGAMQSIGLTGQSMQGVNAKANQTMASFDGLMKATGSAMTVLSGIAMAYASVQQIGKGGTYNTLMGIAGVFSSISAIAGGIGSIGGMFGGAGGGGFNTGSTKLGAGGGSVGGIGTLGPNFGLPARAVGGPVNTGMPYVVGERGPELFIPQSSGTVLSNGQYAATNSYLESAAGRGAMPRLDTSPIRIETNVINGIEYATVDQLTQATQRAEQRGAERGRALALGSLQNSVKTRKRVGIA